MCVHVCVSIQQLSICTNCTVCIYKQIQTVPPYTLCKYLHSCRHFFIQEYKIHFKSYKDSIFYYIQYFRTDLPGEKKGKKLYLFGNFIFKIKNTNSTNISIYQCDIYFHTYLSIIFSESNFHFFFFISK